MADFDNRESSLDPSCLMSKLNLPTVQSQNQWIAKQSSEEKLPKPTCS